jgi:hypothetical protein
MLSQSCAHHRYPVAARRDLGQDLALDYVVAKLRDKEALSHEAVDEIG